MGDVYELADKFRAELLRKERAAASRLVRAYGAAWQKIRAGLDKLDAEYRAMLDKGEKPGIEWIYEHNRLQSLKDQVEGEVGRFGAFAEKTIRREQREAIAAAEKQAKQLVMSQREAIRVVWNRIDRDAVEELLGMTQDGGPLHDLFEKLKAGAGQAAGELLVEGLLLGQNPNETARALRQALGVKLYDALRIARTETLRAYREGAIQGYRANANVVQGWEWRSGRNERTCGACWAMDGTMHGLDERLDDHPNGRCFAVPVTEDLNRKEAKNAKEEGEKKEEGKSRGALAFEKLGAEEQIKVLGPAKWAAWKEGRVTLDENPLTGIVGRGNHPVWGSLRYERSLREIVGKDEAKQFIGAVLKAAGEKAYYGKKPGSKIIGYSFYKEPLGTIENVADAIRIGRDRQIGWEINERNLVTYYLPKHHLKDDVKRTIGLWGTPEPSFNAWLTGSRENVIALAKDWGRNYNQTAMILLLPNPKGEGGALWWDFGKQLSPAELDKLFEGIKIVNQNIKGMADRGIDTKGIDEIGLTVLGHRRVEFWIANSALRARGEFMIEVAVRISGLDLPKCYFDPGYDFIYLENKKDY